MEHCRITHSDTERHLAFFRFVGAIFRNLEEDHWMRWRDRGGWTEDYEVLAITDGGRIVSTIGRTRMRLVVNGCDLPGYQLGAVATAGAYRGQGLARQLMNRVIEEREGPDQPVILFANADVLDFYPRLGFRRIGQRRWTAATRLEVSGTRASQCDVSQAAERSRLASLCARARPIRGPLAARDYYPILLWHLTHGAVTAFWLPAWDAVIAASVANQRLILHDVIAAQPFDLAPVLPTLITHPITELEFRFDAEDWWPAAVSSGWDDAGSALFVHGGAGSIAAPVCFPALAHT